MIFAYTLEQVISGQKSQTRRLAKPDEVLHDQSRVMKGKRVLYEVGRSYAVQPNRGKKSVARIVLTGLKKEPVSKISDADAQAEGYKTRAEFLTAWRTIHGKNADLNAEVWVLAFKLQTVDDDVLEKICANG